MNGVSAGSPDEARLASGQVTPYDRRLVRRRLVKVVVMAVIAALAASSCAEALDPAVEVNDTDFSRSEVTDLAPHFSAVMGETSEPLSVNATGVTIVWLVDSVLVDGELDRRGIVVTDELRQEGRELLSQSLERQDLADEQVAASLEALLELFAPRLALGEFLLEDSGADIEGMDPIAHLNARDEMLVSFISTARSQADVSVDPRYGEWVSDRGMLRLPQGPEQPVGE